MANTASMLEKLIQSIRRGNTKTIFITFSLFYLLHILFYSSNDQHNSTLPDASPCIESDSCKEEFTIPLLGYFSLNVVSWVRIKYWGIILALSTIFGQNFFYNKEAMTCFMTEITILMFLDLILLFFLNCLLVVLILMSACCSVYTALTIFKKAPREIQRTCLRFPEHTKRLAERVTGQNIAYNKCKIDLTNIGYCVVGESSSLTVNLFNEKNGFYKFKTQDYFSANVTRTNSSDTIPIVIEPSLLEGATSIKVSFTCYVIGEYCVNASINRHKLPGIPLLHCASAGKANPGKSMLDLKSDCLVVCEQEQARIRVLPRDMYGNESDMEPEMLALSLLDSDSLVYYNSVERDLTIYLVLFHCGVFRCSIRYDGEVVGSGEFNVVVISSRNIRRLETDIQSDNPLCINVTTHNLENKQVKKKVSCQVTPKQITFTEYYFMFFPSKIATFRMRPATKITIDTDSSSLCINDGKQEQFKIIFGEQETYQLFIAYFNKFLMKNLGGSSDFEEKKSHFYQKIQEHIQNKRNGTQYLSISRASVVDQMIGYSRDLGKKEWCNKWRVEFKGEDGLDYGGVSRELFGILSRQLFATNSEYQYFIHFEGNANPLSHPNPAIDTKQHEQIYILIGQIIAKCLIESAYNNPIFLDARLTRSFLAQLLGLRVCASYFESDDKALYRGKILYMKEADAIEDLEQYFVEEELASDGSVSRTVPLKAGGEDVLVTHSNKLQYLDLLADYRLCKRVRKHMELVCRGLFELIPDTLLSVFDESELELLICGVTTYDIKEWRDNYDVCSTDKRVLPTLLSWFWTLAESLPEAGRARIVQFTTGSGQLPPGGFASLSPKFQIGLSPSGHKLPTAHTCFNHLLLPYHPTYEQFKSMFILAMQEGAEGFGMV